MTSIYDQHSTTFRAVSAYVILKDGERVATVAFKFGNAVTAFVHWIGVEMVKGRATGGGYDKATAAVETASENAIASIKPDRDDVNFPRATFFRVLRDCGGAGWVRTLEEAGFKVLQAV